MILYKVDDLKGTIDYIRASSIDEAKIIFEKRHYNNAVSFQPVYHSVYAVYFTDSCLPMFSSAINKSKAAQCANLYIRQWQLDCKIDHIEER